MDESILREWVICLRIRDLSTRIERSTDVGSQVETKYLKRWFAQEQTRPGIALLPNRPCPEVV